MTLLTRWEPLRESSTMQDRINRMSRLSRESYRPEGPEDACAGGTHRHPLGTADHAKSATIRGDRARRGASGALYPQSALAGLNPLPRGPGPGVSALCATSMVRSLGDEDP